MPVSPLAMILGILAPLAVALAILTAAAFGLGARPAPAADAFQADKAHSSVVFRVKHMNTSNAWGRFNDVSGVFSIDDKDPTQSRFDFEVKTASIDTADAKRDQHLKSPDFFNAVQFPTITFKSRSVTPAAKGELDVAGEMTLHGVTKPVTIRIARTGAGIDMRKKAIAGIEATFTIKRSDFGMTNMVGPVGDDVWVNVSIEGAKS